MRWPSRKPTLPEIYWFAGFFESEGSFTDEGEGGFTDKDMSIPQVDREPLDQARRLVGGGVYGPYTSVDRRTGRTTLYFLWRSSGPRARRIARTIYHLLSGRRKAQAQAFLRISRFEEPPKLNPDDPAGLLWDWCNDPEDLEWR